MNTGSAMNSSSGGPLSGLDVLEFSSTPAAGFAGLLLRFLGAAVTVVEANVKVGTRSGPPFVGADSTLHAYLTAGKEEISSGALETAATVGRANIVIHDEPLPAWLRSRLESDPVPAKGRTVVSCTPYGTYGSKKGWQASELTLFHAGGEGFLIPHGLPYEENPDRPPIAMGRYVAHYQGGLASALAAVAGLRQSRLLGTCTHVDVAVQDVEVSLNYFTISRYVEGTRESRATRAFKYAGLVRCLDGYVEIVPLEHHQWQGLRVMLGNPEWAFSPELEDHVERGKHGAIINEHLRAWAADLTVKEVVDLASANGVPCGPYLPPEQLIDVEQIQHRQYFISPPSRDLGLSAFPGPPWVFNRWGKPNLASTER